MTNKTSNTNGTDTLVVRLQGLSRPAPVELVARARAAALGGDGSKDRVIVRRRRTRRGIIAAVVTFLVAGNVAASYLVPVYAGVIGNVPGVGSILSMSGISGADVTTINSSDEHDGVRMTVVDGYADENGTILTLSTTRAGSPAGASQNWSLTDQFGHTYQAGQASFGDKSGNHKTPDGATPGFVSFAPITGAAAATGARLTLHMTDWIEFPVSAAAVGAPGTVVRGTWSVTFVLIRHPAVHLSLRAATVGGLEYTFPSTTVTDSRLVQIQWSARGPAVAAALAASTASVPPGSAPAALQQIDPQLVDATGHVVAPAPYFEGWFLSVKGDMESGVLNYALTPGKYRLVVRAADGSGFERDLTIG
ncbi:MAG: DUF4179 domain-containing protein [Candidatus Dormibacteria bacterium]